MEKVVTWYIILFLMCENTKTQETSDYNVAIGFKVFPTHMTFWMKNPIFIFRENRIGLLHAAHCLSVPIPQCPVFYSYLYLNLGIHKGALR